MKPRKKYKESTRKIVAAALRWAREKKKQGWTKADAAESLKRMFESDGN